MPDEGPATCGIRNTAADFVELLVVEVFLLVAHEGSLRAQKDSARSRRFCQALATPCRSRYTLTLEAYRSLSVDGQTYPAQLELREACGEFRGMPPHQRRRR
jgi:hypothetical protein